MRSSIADLTVKDPAEAFEILRDCNDLTMLLGHTAFISEGSSQARYPMVMGPSGVRAPLQKEKGKKTVGGQAKTASGSGMDGVMEEGARSLGANFPF